MQQRCPRPLARVLAQLVELVYVNAVRWLCVICCRWNSTEINTISSLVVFFSKNVESEKSTTTAAAAAASEEERKKYKNTFHLFAYGFLIDSVCHCRATGCVCARARARSRLYYALVTVQCPHITNNIRTCESTNNLLVLEERSKRRRWQEKKEEEMAEGGRGTRGKMPAISWINCVNYKLQQIQWFDFV